MLWTRTSTPWSGARDRLRTAAGGLLLALACLGAPVHAARAPAPAVPAAAAAAEAEVSAVDLAQRINVLKTRTDLSATERDLVLEQLRAALTRAEAAEIARKSASAYAAALQSAPETIAVLTAESASVPEPEPLPASADPVTLQLRLAALQAESASLRSRQRSLLEQLRSMEDRPAEARPQLGDLRRQLGSAPAPLPAGASPLLVEASRLREQATHQELSASIEQIEQELLSLPTRKAITTAQNDLLARRIATVDAAVAALNAYAASQRKQQIGEEEARARAFEASLAGQPALLRQFAGESVALRAQWSQLSARLDLARELQRRSQSLLDDAGAARKSADQILAIGSISDQSAKLLRSLQKNLANSDRTRQRMAERNTALVDLRVQQFQTQEALRTLRQALTAQRYLADQGALPDNVDADLDTELVEALVGRRSAALADLADTQEQLIGVLSESSALDSELLQASVQLHSLLDERLLWLPSTAPLGQDWLRNLGTSAVWLARPSHWATVPPALVSALQTRPLALLLLAAAFVALLASHRRLAAALQQWAQPVGRRNDSFHTTLLTCVATLLLALVWPLPLAGLGWSLGQVAGGSGGGGSSGGGGGFVHALGQGVLGAALVWLMLGLFTHMCRPSGLFVAHFGWNAQRIRHLGHSLHLLLLVLAPTTLLTGMANASGNADLIDGLGRFSFLLGSLAMGLFLYRVFLPDGGVLSGAAARQGWRRHLPLLGSRVLVAAPLLLAALAGMGYYATARELQARLFTSGWMVLAVTILYYVALRGVLVTSRRAAWQQADARRARALSEALAARAALPASQGSGSPESTGTGSHEALALQNQEAEIDAVTVSQQTRALLRAASSVLLAVLLLGLWREMIPALKVFNDVVLWSYLVTGSDGERVAAAVTLGHVLASLLTLGLTAIAARTLPGFFEVLLLQRSGINSGTLYAVATIARYAILAIGLLVAFSGIGADWSKLQWIVAALGVGLGFGLQEIVANFISGLIILFERPVRVGDLVTIGNTVGTVSRIKIRAITITDFDNFEVLVPNKAFITETVQNWTLSNEITRLVLKVRVAHGSDVQQAHRLMLDAAVANPQVLKLPEPAVLLLALSDSAMEFEVRVYVNLIDERLPTTHALYSAIVTALAHAGIQIPFPQRDVHVRYADPGRGAAMAAAMAAPATTPAPPSATAPPGG